MNVALANDFYTRCINDPTVDPGLVANQAPGVLVGLGATLAGLLVVIEPQIRHLPEIRSRLIHLTMASLLGDAALQLLLASRTTQCAIGHLLDTA